MSIRSEVVPRDAVDYDDSGCLVHVSGVDVAELKQHFPARPRAHDLAIWPDTAATRDEAIDRLRQLRCGRSERRTCRAAPEIDGQDTQVQFLTEWYGIAILNHPVKKWRFVRP